MFDPDANLPKPNRSLIYFGARLIAGMRLAREKQVNVRVIPTGTAIHESVDLAYELYNCVFRRVPRSLREKEGLSDLNVVGTEQRLPRVYMRFEWRAGWRVNFLDGSKVLPRTLLFRSDEKLFEMAGKGAALKSLAERQALEHAMTLGRGGVHLELSYPQLSTLQWARG